MRGPGEKKAARGIAQESSIPTPMAKASLYLALKESRRLMKGRGRRRAHPWGQRALYYNVILQ